MKASCSFVLAVLLCATTAVFAYSPAGNKRRPISNSITNSSLNPQNASKPVARNSLRLPSGAGTFNPRIRSPFRLCLACILIPSGASAPLSAIEAAGIQALAGWRGDQDSAGTGSASGATGLVNIPTLTGTARQFQTTFSNGGSERFYISFGADLQATHFLYDGWVYIAAPSNQVANLEMDMNQVIANGQTVIFGVQCDGYSGTWDYTMNQGTPENYADVWVHSSAPCNPRSWPANAWHHVQMSYFRDDAGNVTYQSIWLDGAEQRLNVTVPSSFALGWGSVLLTNFQVDGVGASGSTNVYLDNFAIYRW